MVSGTINPRGTNGSMKENGCLRAPHAATVCAPIDTYRLPMRLRFALEMRPPSRPFGAVGRALGAPPRPFGPGPRPLRGPLPVPTGRGPFGRAPAPSWPPLSAAASLARLLVAPCVLAAVRGRGPFAPSPVPPPRLFCPPYARHVPSGLPASPPPPPPSPRSPRGEIHWL